MSEESVIIAGAARTPLGRFQGELAGMPTPKLGAAAIGAAIADAAVSSDAVDEVVMGCVLPAGLGQAPARQAGRFAGIPDKAGATTVNKMCGSGMKAAMLGHDAIMAGSSAIVVAGGMENMSAAPYLLDKARGGYRYGHATMYDHVALDGLEDAYERGRSMGTFGEDSAQAYQFTRQEQDSYAATSVTRARAAIAEGAFASEITAIDLEAKGGSVRIDRDEGPMKLDIEKIPKLKPAFRPDGTITAASSSYNADGAAALVLARRSAADKLSLPVRALFRGHATQSQEPAQFCTAPVGAIRKLLDKVGWEVKDVDLFEINEAFAVVTMIAIRDLGLDPERVNVHGGACALGHPIGATGARIMVTLLNAMERRGVRRGIASLCIGGGEATAVALERPA
ncbi:MAG TPA: acetyl-CoA C-acyltransferase [Alphaproteobacteria bacterium]|nr:acetyl-CoA C-acyltransferase [Alphaproteobacteria bacterium]